MEIVLGIVAGMAIVVCVWLLIGRGRLATRAAVAETGRASAEGDCERLRAELEAAAAKLDEAGGRCQSLSGRVLVLEQQLEASEELAGVHLKAAAERERAFKDEVQKRDAERDEAMRRAFAALSAETLSKSTQEFLKLAKESLSVEQEKGKAELEGRRVAVDALIKPITESLKRTDQALASLSAEWGAARASLGEQIKGVLSTGEQLRAETAKLSKAFTRPEVRGAYGERLQLERIAELAGMSRHCDFDPQMSVQSEDGKRKRPDLIVRMPNERVVVVDSKCPLDTYMTALGAATEPERAESLRRFSQGVAGHVADLSKKGYWSEFEGSADFVVMFLAGDHLFDAALAARPNLLSEAAEKRVLIATPATLIGMLRVIAAAWAEQRLAEEAEELRELGRRLHQHMAVAIEHVARIGKGLSASTGAYDDFVRSYERNLEPTLRRFEEAGVKSPKTMPELKMVAAEVREIEVKPAAQLPFESAKS